METGNNVRRGFTLIELIIVIALIALVGGLVVINAQAILSGLGEEPVERTFQKAVREARFQAAYLKESTYLSYNEEEGVLEIISETGKSLASFPVETDSGDDPPEITFDQILPGEGLQRIRGDTIPVDRLTFRPDRSSTPFEVTIETDARDFTQRYDPFSAIIIHDSRIQ